MKIFKDKTFLWIALLFILGSALFTFGALELFKDKTITITKITHPNTYKELYNLIKSKGSLDRNIILPKPLKMMSIIAEQTIQLLIPR